MKWSLKLSIFCAMLSVSGALVTASSGDRTAIHEQLKIYFIDAEGGQSTLLVTPSGETLLIDAGWAGQDGSTPRLEGARAARDPARIVAAMRDAGVQRIDYLLVTHFHRDHVGGVPELAQLVPILTFIDHADAYPPQERATPDLVDPLDAKAYDAYLPVRARGRHLVPKPGDRLPLKGVEAVVVSTDRSVLRHSLAGAGESNPKCSASPFSKSYPGDENLRSTGIVLAFGKFRFLDVGDLTGDPMSTLVCPKDLIGAVDVYLVAHHGNADAADPATLAAFRPRVAVVNNARRKGGRVATLHMLRLAAGVDSWQLHTSDEAGEDNVPPERVANLGSEDGHWLKVIAKSDGSFSVLNGRTGQLRAYGAR